MRRRLNPAALSKLSHVITLDVRFSEVDSLGMVWHGNYIHYFEVAREAFGKKYGLDYTSLINAKLVVPVVEAQVFYHSPGRLDDRLEITAYFIYHESSKLEMYYEICRASDRIFLAEGRTLQVCTTPRGELLITKPALLRTFYDKWGPDFK